ncbi:hypothetical protein ACE1AT_01660 [Pelatocladus sp. BLCC-F211]
MYLELQNYFTDERSHSLNSRSPQMGTHLLAIEATYLDDVE